MNDAGTGQRTTRGGERGGSRFVDGYLGYLLGQANHALYKDFDAHVRAAGLSSIEWRVLATLHDSEPLTVSIKADGSIFLQEQAVDVGDLVGKLQAISKNNPDRRIFVRGDKDLAYGRIMEVMGTITQGGFTKVALLAEQTAAPASPAPSAKPPAGQRK